MEVDAPAAQPRPTRRIVVPDSSPYDLDSLASSWDGALVVWQLPTALAEQTDETVRVQ